MTDANERELRSLVSGLMLSQQVLLEALLRHDAIGYHQLRETLADALAALESAGDVDAQALRPLHLQLELMDATHQPRRPEEKRPVLDWQDVLRRSGEC